VEKSPELWLFGKPLVFVSSFQNATHRLVPPPSQLPIMIDRGHEPGTVAIGPYRDRNDRELWPTRPFGALLATNCGSCKSVCGSHRDQNDQESVALGPVDFHPVGHVDSRMVRSAQSASLTKTVWSARSALVDRSHDCPFGHPSVIGTTEKV
jgi:hypothetical protein